MLACNCFSSTLSDVVLRSQAIRSDPPRSPTLFTIDSFLVFCLPATQALHTITLSTQPHERLSASSMTRQSNGPSARRHPPPDRQRVAFSRSSALHLVLASDPKSTSVSRVTHCLLQPRWSTVDRHRALHQAVPSIRSPAPPRCGRETSWGTDAERPPRPHRMDMRLQMPPAAG